ncbi:hypothetical protein HOY80DRAFT_1107947 [Tuber brumale]|nr:hypothetical protein HOY80DRAFT_1107947 [Tuber brumale]
MAEPILRTIQTALTTRDAKVLVFDHLDPTVVPFTSVCGRLKLIVPARLHESPGCWLQGKAAFWLANNLLDPVSFLKLDIIRPTLMNFLGRFAGSAQIPDLSVCPLTKGASRDYRSIVLESGWFEDAIHMQRDSELLQEGTARILKVAIFVEIFPTSVFPIPCQPGEDLFITIDELFAGSIPDGLDPQVELPLKMGRLRARMKIMLCEEGYLPHDSALVSCELDVGAVLLRLKDGH